MWLKLAFVGSVLTPILHVVVLQISGQNFIQTPVSELSRHDGGMLHSLALVLFGAAHIALAKALGGLDAGRLWRHARALLIASGVGLAALAGYFAIATDASLAARGASIPLWIVASLTGVAMGALQPGLWRQSRRLGMFGLLCLGAWLWLVPVFFFVDEAWRGGYERIVGGVYVIWMVGITLGLMRTGRGRPSPR